MSHHNVNSSYEDTFYIVPRYIRKLPGITLAFLDVYEIIHQFWNKGLTCFLNNSTIAKRCGIEIRQVQYALDFFEKAGELKRISKGTKRYLVRPERIIEHDSSENIQPCTTLHPPMQSSAPPPCTPVHPEYKEDINKEINNIYTRAEDENLTNKVNTNNYQESYYDSETLQPKESEQFKQFWDIYPIKKQKNKTKTAWYAQGCDKIADEIINKLSQQIKKDADFISGYTPNPFTYITQERWTDEIKPRTIQAKSSNRINMNDTSWANDMHKHLF